VQAGHGAVIAAWSARSGRFSEPRGLSPLPEALGAELAVQLVGADLPAGIGPAPVVLEVAVVGDEGEVVPVEVGDEGPPPVDIARGVGQAPDQPELEGQAGAAAGCARGAPGGTRAIRSTRRSSATKRESVGSIGMPPGHQRRHAHPP
jgi:hypothetical protein